MSSDFETKFAFETKAMPLALGQAMIIVPRSSAIIPSHVDTELIAIIDNHINMVKFLSLKNNEFRKVASYLKLIAKEAPIKVQENWSTKGTMEASK
jgi:hypothetical protein